jgi:hypothetical protein
MQDGRETIINQRKAVVPRDGIEPLTRGFSVFCAKILNNSEIFSTI